MSRFAHVLLSQDGSYVLQHRDDFSHIAEPNTYSAWGGRLHEAETYTQGALRELQEETGVKLAEEDLEQITKYELEIPGPKGHPVKVDTVLFTAEIAASVQVECHEGQAIVRVESLDDIAPNKLSRVLSAAKKVVE